MPIRQWIDQLDAAAMTMSGEEAAEGMAPRELGYSSPAQATGYTAKHPLDAAFLPPVTVYRNDDDLRDLVEQMEAQECEIAESVALVRATADSGERRHLLNVRFPQTRGACEYPSQCAYVKLCYGGEDIRRDPVGSGLFRPRTPNHPQEQGGDKAVRG